MPLQQNQNIWRGQLNKTGRPLHLFHCIQDLQKLHSGINGGTFEEDTKTGENLKNIVKNNFSTNKNKNWTGHGQNAAALWPNTTYTKFGHIPSKKGTWTCPNTCTHACNVHVVPIIVLRIFSYPKFWCLTFFYDKN